VNLKGRKWARPQKGSELFQRVPLAPTELRKKNDGISREESRGWEGGPLNCGWNHRVSEEKSADIICRGHGKGGHKVLRYRYDRWESKKTLHK